MGSTPSSPTPAPPPGKLLNVLGLAFGVSVTVGGCVGVGILVQPGVVARHLPHPGLFLAAWLAGGLYALLGAVSVAELAAMTPRSGAYYVYVRRALGDYPGFVTGWSHWLGLCSGAAFIATVMAGYVARLVPPVGGYEPALAMLIIVGFAALHWRSVRRAGRVQELTTLAKGVGFLALLVALFALGRPGADGGPELPVPTGLALVGAFVLAFPAIVQTYDGWDGAIYFGEEVTDAGRNIPRALFVGTLAVIALYMGVNLALVYVLPVGRIAGHEMAVVAAAEEVFGADGGRVIFALATASILAVFNAGTLQSPRVLYAMSCDGLFFRQAARVNAGGTPTVALALTTAGILAFLALGATVDNLLRTLAFFLITNYALMFVALFVLRWREPEAPRPHRAWGYPWTTALALLGSLLYLGVVVWLDLTERRESDATPSSAYALLALGVSFPVFHLVKRFRRLAAEPSA